jgi:multimeric flavodoxin WrbA
MKTLIFNGSPRKNGDTIALINELLNHLEGEYKLVNAYDCGIKPCIDCRYCVKNNGCAQNDEMQQVYEYIQQCDNILIASPIYFSELTGQLLAITSRLQTYFCARHFRKEKPIEKTKKGGVILVGGGDGDIKRPYDTAAILLRMMYSKDIAAPVYSWDTDNIPAKQDQKAKEEVKQLAEFFNGLR